MRVGGGQGYICGWEWKGWKEREFPLTKQKTGMGDLLSREEEKQLDTRKKRSLIGHMPLASSPPFYPGPLQNTFPPESPLLWKL